MTSSYTYGTKIYILLLDTMTMKELALNKFEYLEQDEAVEEAAPAEDAGTEGTDVVAEEAPAEGVAEDEVAASEVATEEDDDDVEEAGADDEIA